MQTARIYIAAFGEAILLEPKALLFFTSILKRYDRNSGQTFASGGKNKRMESERFYAQGEQSSLLGNTLKNIK